MYAQVGLTDLGIMMSKVEDVPNVNTMVGRSERVRGLVSTRKVVMVSV